MKAYVIRPTMDVFDGTGILSPDARIALGIIAEMVADSLQAGGDNSHQAAVWEGATEVGKPPSIVALTNQQSLAALTFRLLDPNGSLGGDIRSAANCRMAVFGQDGQAMLCLKHEDAIPATFDNNLVTVTECSERLIETDLFDGFWPSA